MKRIINICILFFSWLLVPVCVCASANSEGDSVIRTAINRPADFIDYTQQKIDQFDGKLDGYVNLKDPAQAAYATRVYLRLVDSIQRLIENPLFDAGRKKNYRDNLYQEIQKVNTGNVADVKRFDTKFRIMLNALNAIILNKLPEYFQNNSLQFLNNIAFLKNEPGVDSLLIIAAQYHPDIIFSNYSVYAGKGYALHVIEETSKTAPVTVKRYFNAGNPIYEKMRTSTDIAVKAILQIKEKYGRKSNAYTLLDDIVNHVYTIEQADSLGADQRKYLLAMLKTRVKTKPLAEFSLEDELAIYSLKYVRVVNDLHNENDKIRFASVEDFSAQELYTLMIYSEEEIFTSTFNGFFKRLMTKINGQSGYDFLKELGDNKFRTFIKMSAGFGKLAEFLQTMNPLQQQLLMAKFAGGLEQYNDLSQAVEVADAFSSITDSLVLRLLRSKIRYEYIRLKTTNNSRGATIYGLLSNLFVEKDIAAGSWFTSISEQYKLPPFDKVENRNLFSRDSMNRWVIYFYDDEDGDASFATFLRTFADPNWTVEDLNSYVIIKSKSGKSVNIYANKPKHEYDGQDSLRYIFGYNDYAPNVMVHRGHSYYAYKTIEKVKDNTEIFVLGSCGGYHSISSIIERSPEAGIISSKQIGTMYVNNPMLKLIADYINRGEDIQWQKLWAELEAKVKPNPKAYERFLDYIPPHKNLGAIFIKTYNKMMESSN